MKMTKKTLIKNYILSGITGIAILVSVKYGLIVKTLTILDFAILCIALVWIWLILEANFPFDEGDDDDEI